VTFGMHLIKASIVHIVSACSSRFALTRGTIFCLSLFLILFFFFLFFFFPSSAVTAFAEGSQVAPNIFFFGLFLLSTVLLIVGRY
jgi:hypothetical protein